MPGFRLDRALLTACLALTSAAAMQTHAQTVENAPAAATAVPDSGLYATYSFDDTYANAYVSVCGSVPGSDGCYGGGTMGTFGHVGALIEGNPSVNTTTNTVIRYIYVVDQAVGGGSGVSLDVYKLTEVINAPSATISVKLSRTIPLPSLTGGANAKTYMAANSKYLFIGTNQSTAAVEVAKAGYAMESIGGFSPPIDVSSITADKYGYVTVTFGGVAGEDGFYVFAPDGSGSEDGGGADFMLDTMTGLSTSNVLATTSAAPAVRYNVHYHKIAK